MTERFYAGPEDWPIGTGKIWYAVYDRTTGRMLVLNPDGSGGGAWRTGKANAEKIASQLNRGSRHLRVEAGRLIRTRSQADPKKRPTFAAARAALLDHLKAERWVVTTWSPSGALKTPYATSPDGRIRLWFKPQAVYVSYGSHHELRHSRSLWVDIRDESPSAVVASAERSSQHDARRGVSRKVNTMAGHRRRRHRSHHRRRRHSARDARAVAMDRRRRRRARNKAAHRSKRRHGGWKDDRAGHARAARKGHRRRAHRDPSASAADPGRHRRRRHHRRRRY